MDTDTQTHTAPLDGKNPIHVRKLAHKMRVDLWKKHFALLGHNDVVQPASGLGKLLDKPADPATWRAIQAIAKANTEAYAKAFNWVPRDGASIWPVWEASRKFVDDPNTKENEAGPARIQSEVEPFEKLMPFSEDFWKSKQAAAAPAGIRGFFCALPMLWTQGENNHPDMNMALLTRLNSPAGMPHGDDVQLAARSPSKEQALG